MSNIQTTNVGKLDLRMLLALAVLLRERSVTRGATHAGLSQPAMSNALGKMRIAFGDPLLVRGRKGMVLTERGQTLLDQLTDMTPLLEGLGRPVIFDTSTSDATFLLAVTDHAGLVLVPEIMRLVSQEAPRVVLKLTTVISREQDMERMESSGFDMCVGWFAHLPPHWRLRQLFREELVLVARKDHPELDRPLDQETFLRLRHLVLAPDRRLLRNLADDALAARGLKREVAGYVSNFASMPFIISRTDVVAIMPRRVAEQFAFIPNLTIVNQPFPFQSFEVSLAWHPRVHKDLGYIWLRDLIVRAANNVQNAQSNF